MELHKTRTCHVLSCTKNNYALILLVGWSLARGGFWNAEVRHRFAGAAPPHPRWSNFFGGARASMGVASAFWAPWPEISQGVATGVQKFATVSRGPRPRTPAGQILGGGRAPAWGSHVHFGHLGLKFRKGGLLEYKSSPPSRGGRAPAGQILGGGAREHGSRKCFLGAMR